MVVYIEYAFLENALLDGTLLYVTHKCVRARIRVWRFLLAAALGGAEAVVFPLLPLPAAAAYAVKILGGMLLCAACVPLKKCLPACAAFFALTFLLGGLLTAAYSFFGIETADGTAFYVERAPVALILGGAAAFVCAALAAIGALFRSQKIRRASYPCALTAGGRTVHWTGIADSGNFLSFRGKPVCVISAVGALALWGKSPPACGRIAVSTVNGTRTCPVFWVEKLCVGGYCGGVYVTTGDVGKNFQMIVHTDLLGGDHERIYNAQALAQQNKRGKRRTLFVRERGAAAPAPARGGGGDAQKARGGGGCGDCQSKARRT